MNDNVIEFPKPFNPDSLTDQMMGLQERLQENYTKVMENYMLSRSLELESQALQKSYDEVLMRYAELVGLENIPVGLLEYSTHIVEKDEEEEIVLVQDDLTTELQTLHAIVRETMDELANYLQGMTNDELQ